MNFPKSIDNVGDIAYYTYIKIVYKHTIGRGKKIMKKILAIFCSFAMAFSLVGCGGSSSSASDEFTFASELDINTLDSTVSDDGMSFNAMHACIDGLMGLNAKGKIVNALADKVEKSDDGLTYTYTLRDDANWSNGDPVTSDDFVYAWQRIIKNAGNYAYMMGSEGANIAGADALMEKQSEGTDLTDADMETLGIKADGDKKLVITLATPCSYFDELMTFPCYYPINRKFAEKCGDKYGTKADYIISNGAFKVKSWDLGTQIVYEKNSKYYNKKAVKLNKLTMLLKQDYKTAATSFDSGNNDFCSINSSLVDKYKDEKSYTTYSEGYLFYLQLNMKTASLNNYNVRKALSLAINRTDFAKNVLKDGSKAATGFVPSGLSESPEGTDFRKDAGSYDSIAYNVKDAQAALDAGLKELGTDSITLRLTYGTDESPMDQMATYLQNAFSKLKGLKIEMVATTKKDRIYTKQKNGDFDIACTRWGPDYGDPTTYLNLLTANNANNYGKYTNSAYDAKMKEVQTATDVNARWQDMVDAEKIAMNDLPNIPVFEKAAAVLVNTDYTGIVHKPVGVPYTFNYVHAK
jgi:oligopeptide transport system substrate-binding protein